jgi:SAM-dependent methyltransferase
MPVEIYFRNADDMPVLEWTALRHCRGRILDIGAGAGSHALFLQKTGMNVTALDISTLNARVMEQRGIRQILCQDFFTFKAHKKYDTLLLLMNGIGLAGTLDGLQTFFQKARKLLRPEGRLIFDSSDIAYLYQGKPPKEGPYYGEVHYQYEYRRMRGEWFSWLFVDRRTLTRIAAKEGWNVTLLYKDPADQYLVECTMR